MGCYMLNLYIVRHGKTEWNNLHLAQGSKDIPLNETGLEEAKKLIPKVKARNIDICISSPLQRAKQTAEIICDGQIPIIYDKRLVERSFGDYEGTKMDMDIVHRQWDYNLNTNEHNIEPFRDCLKRAESFLDYLRKEYHDKNILIVSHGCLIKCLHYCINGYDEKTDFEDFFPLNADGKDYVIDNVLEKELSKKTSSD